MRAYLTSLDQQKLGLLVDGRAPLKTCLLAPHAVLYIPVGWVVAITQVDVQGDENALSGARFSFLPKGGLGKIRAELDALKKS